MIKHFYDIILKLFHYSIENFILLFNSILKYLNLITFIIQTFQFVIPIYV